MDSEVPAIGRNWWLFVVLGVICVATGIAAMVWPDITLLALGIIFGIYLMIAAVLEIIDALTGDPGGRALSAIIGVVALIAGLICFRRPGESLLAIVDRDRHLSDRVRRVPDRARARLERGALAGRRRRRVRRRRRRRDPGLAEARARNLAVIFALTMLMRGIVAIWIGLRLRKASGEAATPAEQTATYA